MRTKKLLSGLCALTMVLSAAAQPGMTAIVTAADNELPVIPIKSTQFEYTLLDNGTYEVSSYIGSNASVSVLSMNSGKAVSGIGDGAFFYCMDITSVTLPSSIKNIGSSAFAGCMEMTKINIPSGVESIGDNAFKDCFKLQSVTLPEGLTEIADGTFDSCMALTEITIPDSVKRIGYSAFAVCTGLKKVEIPAGVTEIGQDAFYHCTALTDVTIPDGVTSIGDRAFGDCSSLNSITIPKSVTSIGEEALGYISDPSGNTVKKSGFTISGYAGSAAEAYAKENGITFVALEDDNEAEITLNVLLNVKDKSFVLPEAKVSVDGADTVQTKDRSVTLTLADGTYELTFSAEGGFVSRTYTVTVKDGKLTEELAPELELLGDANLDGTVNSLDIVRIKRHIIKAVPLTGYAFDCANTNGDKSIGALDITRIKRHIIKAASLWKA